MMLVAHLLPLTAISLAFAIPLDTRAVTCRCDDKIAAVKQEIATIRSHTLADANKIPLTPAATRTFLITYAFPLSPPNSSMLLTNSRPNELNAATVPINVGVTADTVRTELVVLATALNAGVPQGSDSYTCNANGTVTVDYVQTDVVALPRSQVREIHSFDDEACQISNIIGYVHGALTGVTAGLNLTQVMGELQAGETVGRVLGGLGL